MSEATRDAAPACARAVGHHATGWRRVLAALVFGVTGGLCVADGGSAEDAGGFRLGPGDKITVTVLRRPDLSGEFRILPSGDLQLPLVGRVEADGRSLDDLQQNLTDRLRTTAFLLEPRVSLELVEASPIAVGGDVQRPGSYPYQSGMTVQHALAFAGGRRTVDIDMFNARSETRRVQERLLQALDQRGMLLLRRRRLEAELRDERTMPQPDGMEGWLTAERLQKGLATENDLLRQRREAFEAQIQNYGRQTVIFNEEIRNLQEQDGAKAREADVIKNEHGIQEQLFAKGFVVRDRAVDYERISMQLQGDRSGIAAEIAKARQEIVRIDQTVRNLSDQRRLDLANLLKDVDDTLANLDVTIAQTRKALRDADAVLPTPNQATEIDGESPYVLVRARRGATLRIAADAATRLQPGDLVVVARP